MHLAGELPLPAAEIDPTDPKHNEGDADRQADEEAEHQITKQTTGTDGRPDGVAIIAEGLVERRALETGKGALAVVTFVADDPWFLVAPERVGNDGRKAFAGEPLQNHGHIVV